MELKYLLAPPHWLYNLQAAPHLSNYSLILFEKTVAVMNISKHSVTSRFQYFMSHLWDTCRSNTKPILFLCFLLLDELLLLFSFLLWSWRMSKRARIGYLRCRNQILSSASLQKHRNSDSAPASGSDSHLLATSWFKNRQGLLLVFFSPLFMATWSEIQIKASSLNYLIDNKGETDKKVCVVTHRVIKSIWGF